jgi:hypothetical protein
MFTLNAASMIRYIYVYQLKNLILILFGLIFRWIYNRKCNITISKGANVQFDLFRKFPISEE